MQEKQTTRPKDPLIYPFEAVPPRGTTLEVAPGVHWIRMPLPYALDHINLWALDDDAGWAIVDTGTRTDENAQVWRELFAHAPDRRGITRIFVTHMHPDHVGMAGWLTRKFNARLWMTRLEYMSCRVMVSDTGREAPPEAIEFFRQAGWGEAAIERYRLRFGNFGKHIHALPESFRRLREGEIIRIGRHDWRVIIGTGHSPEHACLYCAELKVLISGDQVLPRISSNVSVHPTEPDADPMSEWMASIDKLRREVPDDVLVLPSHNEPFRGLHLRLDRLAEGQHQAFARLREALGSGPCRVVDVFGALFSRPISESDTGLLGMATGETLACLNHLIARGEATRHLRDGVHWYALPQDTPG
ncbi:MAG: MBL fold metallo-hydrolase [Curvibacter sp.]|nr:MAG: MBL fold metallo-hydrolase [Curvibacter sp.]